MSERYRISKYIAGGTGGRVFLGIDQSNSKNVAIKAIQFFINRQDQYKRPYREICVLKHINSHFCLSILDLYASYDVDQLREVCLVLPYIEYDLSTVTIEFNLVFIQIIQIFYQLLMGLNYLHDCGIIHRDLKPANIGINADLDLKILDFGLAREKHNDLTKYVVTRYYRPLEAFYMPQYTTAVDMWSAGCIFAELFTKQILFKGKTQVGQSICILEVLGWPDENMLNKMELNARLGLEQFHSYAASSNLLEDKIRNVIEKFVVDYGDGDQQNSNDIIILLTQILELNPEKRITPREAIKSQLFVKHNSFINSYVEIGTATEFRCSNYPEDADDEFWKELLITEIDEFNPLQN